MSFAVDSPENGRLGDWNDESLSKVLQRRVSGAIIRDSSQENHQSSIDDASVSGEAKRGDKVQADRRPASDAGQEALEGLQRGSSRRENSNRFSRLSNKKTFRSADQSKNWQNRHSDSQVYRAIRRSLEEEIDLPDSVALSLDPSHGFGKFLAGW